MMQLTSEEAVEGFDIGVLETASVFDRISARELGVAHEAEDHATRRSGEPHRICLERAQDVAGKPLVSERRLDTRADQRSRRPEVVLSDIGDEDRKQRPRVHEQEALAAVKPQHVRVPVVITRGSGEQEVPARSEPGSRFQVRRGNQPDVG
jgi:hypothetical protein